MSCRGLNLLGQRACLSEGALKSSTSRLNGRTNTYESKKHQRHVVNMSFVSRFITTLSSPILPTWSWLLERICRASGSPIHHNTFFVSGWVVEPFLAIGSGSCWIGRQQTCSDFVSDRPWSWAAWLHLTYCTNNRLISIQPLRTYTTRKTIPAPTNKWASEGIVPNHRAAARYEKQRI